MWKAGLYYGKDVSHTDYVMTNNFAFGGINTSLIFKRWNNSNK